MYAITGATGALGRLVISALLKEVPADAVVALARDPAKLSDLAAQGVVVRQADYDEPETLTPALAGVERLLLISSSEVGRRTPQHEAVIDAARAAGVKLIAYTSILRADTSALALAKEHRETEAILQRGGVPWVLLRNGWYTENYVGAIPAALEHGALLGSAGDGRISSAARMDYAEAAAAVLTAEDQAGRVYELAGDDSFTMAEMARELSSQSGMAVAYRDLREADYRAALVGAGLPDGFAGLIAQSAAAAREGALYDEGGELGGLIGRPTTPLKASIAAALRC